ncbi:MULTISPECIES: TetR/AcrR family transcriptional regulator [Mesonia]|uniref:TetR/AcrR family transcriptional regulator n=1 Tax=Mesonia TaxID=232115 RepID=UPI001762191A|nr:MULTISPECIES: helix-turn-helix domain-containing protein [Mesonia]HIB36690.1 TetR/AcrR family transcriptional regulator [Mesonia sp.]HIO25836.1 TetR/AcrR family transcriptional regulator [Flavobacteriaceae bacterium]
MPRTKKYNENEVIEKAMHLFWKNGYTSTSMQMLEKQMGINKFSIYASFQNKNGVFVKSLACYKQKLNKLFIKLNKESQGIAGIKQFFYDFIKFTKEDNFGKGCLVVNTANEVNSINESKIADLVIKFTNEVKEQFKIQLKRENNIELTNIEQKADYLIISMYGLSSATKVFSAKQLDNYIEGVFKKL